MSGIDLKVIRSRLKEGTGQHYWRSLEELAETDEFRDWLEREFPAGASEWHDGMSRREFLRLMAGSLVLAGAAGCTAPPVIENIVPYVDRPEEIVPGKPLFFATAMEVGGYASGLLVKSHEGRPTKVEGNPEHPFSLGATTSFGQAAILGLYDPDRSQAILREGEISTWGRFLADVNLVLQGQESKRGAGIRVLSGTVTSPTLRRQMDWVIERFPAARWIEYEPAGLGWTAEGTKLIFGEELQPHYDFSVAEVILSLESDFLFSHPASLRYARQFYRRRREFGISRLYAVEGTPTLTGTAADHRLPVRSGEIEDFAFAVAQELGVPFGGAPVESGPHARWIRALAADLEGRRGRSLVVAGEQQPPLVHAVAHAMNATLGNIGKTVSYTAALQPGASVQLGGMRELVEEMNAGAVNVLLVLGGNPVFTAPVDLDFAAAMQRVETTIHWSLYLDETSDLCRWHIPATHFLESWSDTRAWDGTASIVQPLIAPLYGGVSCHETIDTFVRVNVRDSYELVRDTWRERNLWADFEQGWRRALHSGWIEGSHFPAREVRFDSGGLRREPREGSGENLELVFRPDPAVWDGRFANNGWLQETPRPFTKITWDNAALISPALAERLQLASGDLVHLHYRGRRLKVATWVLPGQAEHTVTLHLGYGRGDAGRVGNGVGFNAYLLRTTDAPWFGEGLRIEKIGGSYAFATTQQHHNLGGRDIFRAGTVDQFQRDPDFVRKMGEAPEPHETLYNPKEHAWDGQAWGMAIDLSSCFGCNACVVACQSENNIPIVGKREVLRHREMHWIRIDTYFTGSIDNPETTHQAVACMHCENAPCELVCPVAATVHSVEGLNEQIYNRCIGTRYCSNNCPYKVRRFNFLEYSDRKTPVLQLLKNPNVTVRSRGVMEKCTYCVQRINAARIEAKKENRLIRDGEVVPACAAACPAESIVFGDISDPDSRVSILKGSPLNYGMLAELNTRPRTTYLAKLRNPNPALDEA